MGRRADLSSGPARRSFCGRRRPARSSGFSASWSDRRDRASVLDAGQRRTLAWVRSLNGRARRLLLVEMAKTRSLDNGMSAALRQAQKEMALAKSVAGTLPDVRALADLQKT